MTEMLNMVGQWMPRLLDGLWLSLQVTGVSLVLGIAGGLALAVLALSRKRPVRILSTVVTEIGRGTPALVMLQFVYFGLPQTGIMLEGFAAAATALTLTTAAYTSEIIRAGLKSVPQGELEASSALGISRRDSLRFIIIPQGMRIAIPSLLGFSILMFQVSSLAFTIGLPELLSQAYSIGASNFRYLEVLTVAGLLYLAVTIPAGWFTRRVERKMSQHL
ncbi:amino acid ABC transporter permease [Arthrobacter mobilis]|uniref:Amino acid ABC transporter permease n=1 Tax=Arthrobacter mobilis TaxID=2724944 RepID=A0A7X6HE34_9MICC|nr:amino acid ABC transporter permease [Arthrobacter mobilis]NKX55423.1 amino acid ABC transporter permease [Arthrobacter mobilis]